MTEPTETDVERLKRALENERDAHKATKNTLRAELEAANAKLAELPIAGTSPNAAAVSEYLTAATKAGVAQGTAELNGRITALETELAESKKNGETLSQRLASRAVESAVREAARAAHVKPEAIADALTFGSLELKLDGDTVVDAEGRSVADWLESQKSQRGYWWPLSRGAGAIGSMGGTPPISNDSNPFAKGPAYSLTEQGNIFRSDPARAARLQAAAK
jgi:hypothetical protein